MGNGLVLPVPVPVPVPKGCWVYTTLAYATVLPT